MEVGLPGSGQVVNNKLTTTKHGVEKVGVLL